MSSQEPAWMRQATSQEAAFHAFTLESSHVIGYVLRVATSRPLEEDDVKSALSILQKRTPTLRIIFAERDGEIWLKETTKEVDFQVVHDADVKDWFMKMSHQSFKEDGPLWRATFCPWSPSQSPWVESTKMEDLEEDGNISDVPHLSHVIFSFHHGIADGYSCCRIVSHFLRFLNELIEKKPIVDDEPIAQIIDVQEQNRVKEEVENLFKSDSEFLDEQIQLIEKLTSNTLIEKAYPCKSGLPENMDILMHLVDRATTTCFRSRCKAEGVTFHAAFCTVIHASIVNIVSDYIKDIGEVNIPSNHAINARRYYNDGSKTAFGLGMKGFGTAFQAPIDILKNFWIHAKKFHEDLAYCNEVKAGFHSEVISSIAGVQSLPELLMHTSGSPLPKMRYYVSSNMMDVTPILGNVGDNVKLVFYDRTTYMPRFPALFLTNFQTFRGQLLHSLQYNAQFLSHDAAKKISETIFQIFEEGGNDKNYKTVRTAKTTSTAKSTTTTTKLLTTSTTRATTTTSSTTISTTITTTTTSGSNWIHEKFI
ncbi:hypothetical protein FHG87_017626 [Trinorchestia longiramus]|nr:hypothetical protein FHG87_017626 [Trinorchestia longiramus]